MTFRAAELAACFAPMSLAACVTTLLGIFEQISRDDDRELLPRIEAQTLILSSTAGIEIPSGVWPVSARSQTRGAPAELPGADHFASTSPSPPAPRWSTCSSKRPFPKPTSQTASSTSDRCDHAHTKHRYRFDVEATCTTCHCFTFEATN
jgi:hypothetical protein